MLYWLLYEKLFPFFHPFRIFRYLTFRTAFASLTALLIALFIGPYVIQKLQGVPDRPVCARRRPAVAHEEDWNADHGRRAHLHRHSAAHGAVVRPGQSVCVDRGFLHACVRRHRVCRRLHQGSAAAQPGIDGARQAALAGAGWRVGCRGAGRARTVRCVFHAACPCPSSRACDPICCGMAGRRRFRTWACFAFVPFVVVGSAVAGGYVERRKPDRRARRAGHRLHHHRRGRAGGAHLHQRPRGLCRLPWSCSACPWWAS